MNNWKPNSRHDDHKEEKPPHSRIFVVCDKRLRETDLRPAFERFGTIEDLFMPKNRVTGESNGVAYIRYSKTSSAANAIREMHLKTIKNESKLMKVMVATNKNEKPLSSSEDRHTRLFIKVPRAATELDISQHFENFGKVASVFLQRDKLTDENKGFAYVKYDNFVDAARAFEECDRSYKPVFAVPRDELKRSRNSLDSNNLHTGSQDRPADPFKYTRDDNNITSLISTNPQSYKSIIVNCSPHVPQKYIEDLFNVIPGMVQCQYTADVYNGYCKAVITYQEEKAAAYAVERLNKFEFPSGELITVKPDENPLAKAANNLTNIINSFKNGMDNSNPDLTMLADAIAQASTLIKVAATSKLDSKEESPKFSCNVDLPPPEPMASSSSEVALRLFIVCKPQPPPLPILRDVFCRFGNLIHISTFPNKTFGFVKYASTRSALDAMALLNGAVVAGVKFKVMEANERPSDDTFGMNDDQDLCDKEHDTERKRMKLDNRIE
ncbi:RNA-binding protein 45-like [Epargyreus clarus]|uniref:RNA-binding protein 45-like n=1 Tax=Epargyreus clarus TaxID=520877 RepID=UPI003C2C670C